MHCVRCGLPIAESLRSSEWRYLHVACAAAERAEGWPTVRSLGKLPDTGEAVEQLQAQLVFALGMQRQSRNTFGYGATTISRALSETIEHLCMCIDWLETGKSLPDLYR